VLVPQRLDPHPLLMGQSEGHVINAFADNGKFLGHAET